MSLLHFRFIQNAKVTSSLRRLSFVPTSSMPAEAARRITTDTLHSGAAPGLRHFPAWFARGGTSNGLVVHRDHLPPRAKWHAILPAAMGSPDALYGRQLDGLGSGVSSTSKVVVLGPPAPHREREVDAEFTFVQVGIRDGVLDTAGNCGNMSSVVGPAAWDMGLVPFGSSSHAVEMDPEGRLWATVRVLNMNTNKLILSRFRVEGSPLVYCPEGDYQMDGVPGKHSKITLSFLHPEGSKTGSALPTGKPIDELHLPDGSIIEASLVDVGNPGVFVSTLSLGLDASHVLTPQAIEANPLLKTRLEQIRRAGASKMGLDPDTESIPKIVLLMPRSAVRSSDIDIQCVALSMGQAHKAVPLTLALCLGAASRLQRTIAWELMGGSEKDMFRIGHPSGVVDVGTKVKDGKIQVAQLLRTARVFMKGLVYY